MHCSFFLSSENLSLTDNDNKDDKGKKKPGKATNIVEEEKKKKPKKQAPKLDPAEERAMKELNKVAAYQARAAKKSNKLKKIRAVVDDSERFNAPQKGKPLVFHENRSSLRPG